MDQAGKAIPVTGSVYGAAGGSQGGGGASTVEYQVEVLTDPCANQDTSLNACIARRDACEAKPKDAANDWRLAEVSTREVGATAWDPLGVECLNFAVIAGQVTPEMVRQEMINRVPTPAFTLSPGTRGIVELPEIVSVTTPAGQARANELVFAFPLVGQQVVLTVTALNYHWTFGDGAALDTADPGQPYTPATPCSSDTTCDTYVHHTYTASASYPITVTVTWHGAFTVNGAGAQNIPHDLTITSAAVTLPVAEVQTVNSGH